MRSANALVLVAGLGLCAGAAADSAGVYIGGGLWDQAPKGDVTYQGDEIDVEDDIDLDADSAGFGWVAIEHPVPLLPNVRVQATSISADGRSTLQRSVTFGGTTFNVSEDIDSDVTLDQVDALFYYQVLDNVVSVDLGVNVKRISGDARLESLTTGAREKVSFDAYIPMAYGALGLDLPLTGLSAGVEGSAVGYDGSSLSDITARVRYETDFHIGIEGGYRVQRLKLDDIDDIDSDLRIDGPYAAGFVHF